MVFERFRTTDTTTHKKHTKTNGFLIFQTKSVPYKKGYKNQWFFNVLPALFPEHSIIDTSIHHFFRRHKILLAEHRQKALVFRQF